MKKIKSAYKSVARFLVGKKTYIAMTACGVAEVAFAFGYITAEQREALLKLFGGAGAMAFAAKINRAVESLKLANNLALRDKR